MSATERQAEKRSHQDDEENGEEVVSTKQSKKGEEVIKDANNKGEFPRYHYYYCTG